jgi:hypothetical protein
MQDDLWEALISGYHSNRKSQLDEHISGSESKSAFESIRSLTDSHRSKNALKLPVGKGAKVIFKGSMGSYLSHDELPEDGEIGEVVTVKSAGSEVTSHDGVVFVKWNSGKFIPVHSEYLQAAPKTAAKSDPDIWWLVAEGNRILGGPFTSPIEADAKMLRLAPETRRKTMVTIHKMLPKSLISDALSRAESKGVATKAAERVERQASRICVASLGDLTEFLKVADNTLIHKSTKDLWKYSKDADGNFLVERLFDSKGEPIKG